MPANTYGGYKPGKVTRKRLASLLGVTQKETREFQKRIEKIVSKRVSYKLIYLVVKNQTHRIDVINAPEIIAEKIIDQYSDSLMDFTETKAINRKPKQKLGSVEERLQPILTSSNLRVKDAHTFVKSVLSNSKNISKNEIIPAVKRLRRKGLPIHPVAVANEINDSRKRRLPDPKEISIPMGGHPKGRKPRG